MILSVSGTRFTSSAAAVTAAAQAAAEVAAGGQAADHKQSLQRGDPRVSALKKAQRRSGLRELGGSYLCPPAGEDKVSVDVLLPKLLGHVQPQRAIFVIDVAFGGVVQDGVSVVDLLKLIRRFGIVGILVRVELQRQFPEKGSKTMRARLSARHRAGPGSDVSPVRPLDVVRRGHFLNSQHVVERLSSGGQRALPLVLSHDL